MGQTGIHDMGLDSDGWQLTSETLQQHRLELLARALIECRHTIFYVFIIEIFENEVSACCWCEIAPLQFLTSIHKKFVALMNSPSPRARPS